MTLLWGPWGVEGELPHILWKLPHSLWVQLFMNNCFNILNATAGQNLDFAPTFYFRLGTHLLIMPHIFLHFLVSLLQSVYSTKLTIAANFDFCLVGCYPAPSNSFA